jgi:hypothetical protein
MSLAPKPTCRWIIRTRPAHGVAASHLQRAATRQRNRGARWAGVAGAAGQGAPGRDESCKDYDMAAPGLANPNAPWGFFTANEFDDGTVSCQDAAPTTKHLCHARQMLPAECAPE